MRENLLKALHDAGLIKPQLTYVVSLAGPAPVLQPVRWRDEKFGVPSQEWDVRICADGQHFFFRSESVAVEFKFLFG